VSAVLWATYTIEARRAGVDALHATAIITVISGALFVPIYLLLPEQGLWHASGPSFGRSSSTRGR
jgi:drug/metabolite transporter (DMT)-like permease